MGQKWRVLILPLAAIFIMSCSSRQAYRSAEMTDPPLPEAINVNTATVDQLEALPHVGRKTAETIVRFRKENGPFRRPEYLLQIHGISEKRFLEIRPLLRTE